MCKGCDLTRQFEQIMIDRGMLSNSGHAGFSDPTDFEAAINASINILVHIAAAFPHRQARKAFLADVEKALARKTKERVEMGGSSPVPMH